MIIFIILAINKNFLGVRIGSLFGVEYKYLLQKSSELKYKKTGPLMTSPMYIPIDRPTKKSVFILKIIEGFYQLPI